MNKWYQEIIVLNKEIDGSMFYCFDEENYKKISDEREEQLKEIERLNKDLGYITKLFAIEKEKNRQAIEELENIPINANGGDILESERKVYHILKGSDKE